MTKDISKQAVELVEKLEAFHSSQHDEIDGLDRSLRWRLSEIARKVTLKTESQGDTMNRINYSVMQQPLAKLGLDTNIFEVLAESEHGEESNAYLAEKTKVHPALMKRLLRYYQSVGMIDQPADDAYRANNITKALISPMGRSTIPFLGYDNPTDSKEAAWYKGHKTTDPLFAWIGKRPEVLDQFLAFMSSQRDGLPTFFDVVDFEDEFVKGFDAAAPVFVDVGGAMGHQAILVRQKYPALAGRVVLEDTPQVLEQARSTPLPGFDDGIKTNGIDFFKPGNHVKGARAYYLRNVLHDWTDVECIQILKNIKDAMGSASRILIDEMVLPECGSRWRSAQQDWAMNMCFCTVERTRAEWEALLAKVGLKILKVWQYTDENHDCVIMTVPV